MGTENNEGRIPEEAKDFKAPESSSNEVTEEPLDMMGKPLPKNEKGEYYMDPYSGQN